MKFFSQINSVFFMKIRSRNFEKKLKPVNDETRGKPLRMVAKTAERQEKTVHKLLRPWGHVNVVFSLTCLRFCTKDCLKA